MPPQSKNHIKTAVEKKLIKLLQAKRDEKPEKEDLQILSLGIKYLAVSVKLDEDSWGSELKEIAEGGQDDDGLEPEIDS